MYDAIKDTERIGKSYSLNSDLEVISQKLSIIRIGAEQKFTTFKEVLSREISSDSATIIAFSNVSDCPFSFSVGYSIAIHDRMLTLPGTFVLFGISYYEPSKNESVRININ